MERGDSDAYCAVFTFNREIVNGLDPLDYVYKIGILCYSQLLLILYVQVTDCLVNKFHSPG